MALTKIGLDAVLKIGTAGAVAATPVPNARDITVTIEDDELDATSRGSAGWNEIELGNRSLGVEFDMVAKVTDSVYGTLLAAKLARTAISVLVLDAATGQGPDFDAKVVKFNISNPLKDIQTVSVTLKPTPSTRAPAWHATGVE